MEPRSTRDIEILLKLIVKVPVKVPRSSVGRVVRKTNLYPQGEDCENMTFKKVIKFPENWAKYLFSRQLIWFYQLN